MKFKLIHLLLLFILLGCADANEENSDQILPEIQQEEDSLLKKVLEAHGNLIDFQFVFRNDAYEVTYTSIGFSFTKTVLNDSLTLRYGLTQNGLVYTENGLEKSLSEEESSKISEAINSVVYFVCLPQKLTDPGVKLEWLSVVTIKNQGYHVLKVSFEEEGGGTDFQDIFYYWVNEATNQVDFFAYQYNVNGGGVRFREAFNSRVIQGMRFQDYVNYSAAVGTPLDSLPQLFARGELEKLSMILTEDVRAL